MGEGVRGERPAETSEEARPPAGNSRREPSFHVVVVTNGYRYTLVLVCALLHLVLSRKRQHGHLQQLVAPRPSDPRPPGPVRGAAPPQGRPAQSAQAPVLVGFRAQTPNHASSTPSIINNNIVRPLSPQPFRLARSDYYYYYINNNNNNNAITIVFLLFRL